MKKIIVTGAAGFLGGRLAAYLGENTNDYQIVATSRRNNNTEELRNKNCEFIAGDLTDAEFCNRLVVNAEIVIHCAALSSPYGAYDDFYKANCVATENLLIGSKKACVKKFIYISTPSIYVNSNSRLNVKESDPLPSKMINNYAKTKLISEKIVLENNGKGILTIALRPRAIIGAGDTIIFPRILEAYKEGKLKIIGDGKNICDLTSVRNVIEAVLCCLKTDEKAWGEAYNITDGHPVAFWETLNYALKSLQLSPPTTKIPRALAMFIASIIEFKAKVLKQKSEPPLIKYSVGVLADSFTLDISKAKKMLNFTPQVTSLQSIDEFVNWYKNNSK